MKRDALPGYSDLPDDARERILRALLILAARGRAVMAQRVGDMPAAITNEASHATTP